MSTTPGTGGTTAKLTKWGGWSLIVIAVAHCVSVIVLFPDQWGAVFGGELQGDSLMTRNHETHLAFWALLGSFAVPSVLLGCMAIGRAREGRTMPAYVAWVLLADAIIGGWLIFPSGHVYSLIPVALFLIDRYRSPRATART